jgi:DNA (cytosine-5)-methyltransferase 1
MNNKTLTAISLFSGMGGDSFGMTSAGCKLIAYNELNPIFCKSHESNFPDSELITDDEKTTNIQKIPDTAFTKYNGITDILFAGFPCQGFSNAGKKKDDDPRNTLFLEFLRVARLTNPYMIIGENVKGLLTKKTATGESYVNVIVSEFEKLGYDVVYKVFKTHEYGVPQKRERLIILGVKTDNPYGWVSSFPEPLECVPDLKSIITYNMRGVIRVDSSLFDNIPDECILTNMNDDTCESGDEHPYLRSKLNATGDALTYGGKTHQNLFSFGKRDSPIHCEIIDIRKPSKTIICTYNHQPRLFVPLKNRGGCYLRMMLPDELKMIQGFPRDYIIHGNDKQKIIQIGNAVPPPLIKMIVEHVKNRDVLLV